VKSFLLGLIFCLAFAASGVAVLLIFRHASFGVLAGVLFAYLCVLILVAAVMLNYPRTPRQVLVNDFIDELEARDRLTCASFVVDRAFRVEGARAEGPHYFLELEDGGIFHLCGNYLYNYEPIEGAPRHFPCTRFTVRRHAEAGYVVDLVCGGLVIEPEIEAPPFTAQDFAEGRVPGDGVILRDISFDQLSGERIAAELRAASRPN